jgi:hypothetical protein
MIALLLMALAAIVFALRLFKVEIGDADLLALGLFFMAASFCFWLYWGPARRVP